MPQLTYNLVDNSILSPFIRHYPLFYFIFSIISSILLITLTFPATMHVIHNLSWLSSYSFLSLFLLLPTLFLPLSFLFPTIFPLPLSYPPSISKFLFLSPSPSSTPSPNFQSPPIPPPELLVQLLFFVSFHGTIQKNWFFSSNSTNFQKWKSNDFSIQINYFSILHYFFWIKSFFKFHT